MSESTHKSKQAAVGQDPRSDYSTQQAGEHDKSATHEATEASESAERTAAEMGAQAKEEFAKAGDAVTREAGKAAESVRRRTREFAHQQKMRLAGEVEACCAALEKAATRFDEDSETNLGRYAGAAAEQLDRTRAYLEDRDMEEMLADTEEVVRNHREFVYGACFVAGLGIARFLKSSGRRSKTGRPEGADERLATLKPHQQSRPPVSGQRHSNSASRQPTPAADPTSSNLL